MDTGVEMRSADLHEAAADAPPEMPGRCDRFGMACAHAHLIHVIIWHVSETKKMLNMCLEDI